MDLPPGDFDASIEWVPGPELEPVVAMTGTDPAPYISAALLVFGLG